MATTSLVGIDAGATRHELQLPPAYWNRTSPVLPLDVSPGAAVTSALWPVLGERQPSAVMPHPAKPMTGAGRRVTVNAGAEHENVVPSHSVTWMRHVYDPAARYDGVARLAFVVRTPELRTVALASVVKPPPAVGCTCTRAVAFCSRVVPSDHVNPTPSVVLVLPNTAMLVVHDAPLVPANAVGATTPERAMAATAAAVAERMGGTSPIVP